jgi:hypothetical protein
MEKKWPRFAKIRWIFFSNRHFSYITILKKKKKPSNLGAFCSVSKMRGGFFVIYTSLES